VKGDWIEPRLSSKIFFTLPPPPQEISIKFTITDCQNFDKRCSCTHFSSFFFYYYCTLLYLLHEKSCWCWKFQFQSFQQMGNCWRSRRIHSFGRCWKFHCQWLKDQRSSISFLCNYIITCSWHKKTKPRIHQFDLKCCIKAREPLKTPCLMVYYFLLITLKNILSLAFSFSFLSCSTLNSWFRLFLMYRTGYS